ncbi:NADH-quinone oxidoreductase subunit L [Alphaproteobacteria bacterium]|nr:NADH-quinone oxidoreductase subunit L [Alphaproteobacteria bacterium]
MTECMMVLCLFAPLISAIGMGLFGPVIKGHWRSLFPCAALFLSAFAAWVLFFTCLGKGGPVEKTLLLLPWLHVGGIQANWAIHVDMLVIVMMMLVSSVSALVHLYSVEYMKEDPGFERFMSYLGLFTFMMLMLVCADDMLQLFFGWEGVGLCSYLLIGFWYTKESANKAAMKAFIVNRVGDLFLVMGLGGLYALSGTLNIADSLAVLSAAAPVSWPLLGMNHWSMSAYDILGLLFFVGAMGKSAQLGLHTWLPDAMEGPTPVSALIHAATMVTAGVFLLAKLSVLYTMSPIAASVVTWVGAATAVFAGTIAIVQQDIKRIIAYSTCSQLGYMFLAIGVRAFNGAIFHLMTHGFFKALLFLGAGAVIHGMSYEQNIFKMGGLMQDMRLTFIFMVVGSLALVGLPIFAGYYSKEAILTAAYQAQGIYGLGPYLLGIAALILTALYSTRLLVLVFIVPSQADEEVKARIHEPGTIMMLPLAFLAIGSVVAGFLGEHRFLMSGQHFWGQSLVAPVIAHGQGIMAHLPTWIAVAAVVIFGVIYAIFPTIPQRTATALRYIYQFFVNQWFIDRLYQRLFVDGARFMGRIFWKRGDIGFIDRYALDGLAKVVCQVSKSTKQAQTGLLYHYTTVMVVGFVLAGVFVLSALMMGAFHG